MIEKKDNNYKDFDHENNDYDDIEDEEFDEDGENKIDVNDEQKDITDNVNSELSQKYCLEYLKYQHKLYSEKILNQRIFNSLRII